MAVNAKSSVLRQLHFVVASWKEDERTDVELLHRFVETRDEQAFTTLVGRHGEMVWGVCLRLLRNRADAEDALQGTFLRLARDANRILNREALAGWLFRVARDCSIDLRRSILRQRRIEERLAAVAGRVEGFASSTDLRVILDDELALLSNSERSVLILVCLEGRTYADTALELGCSIAAVHRRFVRAQSRFRRRLARHGTAATRLVACGLAISLAHDAVAASPRLLARSVESGLVAARSNLLPAVRAGSLAAGAAADRFHRGLALAATTIAVALIGGFCAAIAPFHRAEAQPGVVEQNNVGAAAEQAPSTALSGLIRGVDGKPLAGAEVVALARRPFGPGGRGLRDEIVAKTAADGEGRFTLRVPDSIATWFADRVVTVQASAPGLAPTTLPVRVPSAEGIELRLARGSELRGRLLGPDDRPAAGVRVEVVRVGDAAAEPVIGAAAAAAAAPPGWPTAVTTDREGTFTLPGIGSCKNVWVRVSDPRFALDTFRVDHSGIARTSEFRLDAAVPLDIEVRAADTGKAIGGARVTIITDRLRSHAHFCATDHAILCPHTIPADIDAIADQYGHIRVGVARGDRVEILVHPSPGADAEPLVGVRALVEVGKGTQCLKHTVRLPRGRWVSGTVTDDATKRPIAGAVVHWGRQGATKPEWRDDVLVGRDSLTHTGPDGRFRLAVLPGACLLRVYGTSLDHPATPARTPGTANSTLFAHAVTRLDISAEGDVPTVRFALLSGRSVVVNVERRSGDIAAFALCSGRVSPVRPYACLALPVRHNSFAVPGCRPDHVTRAYILDPAARVGAIVDVSPEDLPPVQKLAACGTIRFRVVCADGIPRAGQEICVSLLAERDRLPAEVPVADPQPVEWFDPVNYPTRPKSDANGMVELPALIPGARYAIAVGSGKGKVSLGSLSVTPGATVTLPDVNLADTGDAR